jgi:hypothetical protein
MGVPHNAEILIFHYVGYASEKQRQMTDIPNISRRVTQSGILSYGNVFVLCNMEHGPVWLASCTPKGMSNSFAPIEGVVTHKCASKCEPTGSYRRESKAWPRSS